MMTKQETNALLEAVKKAPIVGGKITVTVCGTTFTFGGKDDFRDDSVTEENRQQWLDFIGRSCRAKTTWAPSKKELDEPGLRHQNRIVHHRLSEYVRKNKLKTSKYTENFYFVLDVDEKYKFISREDKPKAVEFARSIGKTRNDVFEVMV